MKAVLFKAPRQIGVENVPDPKVEAPTDAIVRMTSAAICGSDLHMYAGRTSAKSGLVLGHEPLGIIEQVGSAVTLFKKGDRVVVPFNISCGICYNCTRGFTSACLTMNPDAAGAAYGYAGLGPFRGAQAELLRVPFADFNCMKLPGMPKDEWEDDFVLLADVFPTGYYANDLAGVGAGSTVAVFGAGPVGLLAAYSAILLQASEVYVVDYVPERLKLVEQIGAHPVDFTKGDPVEQIFDLRKKTRQLRPGDEKMPGVMCGIEAVGYQARDWRDPSAEDPTRVIEDLIRLVNPTGRIAAVGLYVPYDPGGVNPHAKKGELKIAFGELWTKGISLSTGQTPVKKYLPHLLNLIVSKKAKPSFIVTHRAPLSMAPVFYEQFHNRSGGCVKVVLKPEE